MKEINRQLPIFFCNFGNHSKLKKQKLLQV
jgi:hypothetical protein